MQPQWPHQSRSRKMWKLVRHRLWALSHQAHPEVAILRESQKQEDRTPDPSTPRLQAHSADRHACRSGYRIPDHQSTVLPPRTGPGERTEQDRADYSRREKNRKADNPRHDNCLHPPTREVPDTSQPIGNAGTHAIIGGENFHTKQLLVDKRGKVS